MYNQAMKKVFFFLMSVLITLYIGEFLVSRFIPQKTYSAAYQKGYNCFAKSNVTVFTLKPNCTIPFSDYDTGEEKTAHINSFGYRGREFDSLKKPGEKRILLEGDSFILGFGVGDEDVVSKRLEILLPNTTVINAGYAGGFGPDGYFLHLKNSGITLQPDITVFSVFVFNDLSDLADNEWIGVGPIGEPEMVVSKTTLVDDSGFLLPASLPLIYKIPIVRESNLGILASNGISNFSSFVKNRYERVKFALFPPVFPTGDARDSNLPGIYKSNCIFNDTCHRQTMRLYSDLYTTILASKKLVDNQFQDTKEHFIVLLIPVEFQLYPETYAKYQDSGIPKDIDKVENPNPQRRIKEMLEKEKIAYIDLLPIMRKNINRLYFVKDGHWNPEGHKVAAEALAEWIKKSFQL